MSTIRTDAGASSRTRRIARAVSALGSAALLGGMALLAACADAPSGPQSAAAVHAPAAPSSSLLSPVTTATGTLLDPLEVGALLRDVPLEQDVTRSWTVKRTQNTTLEWPEMGLKVSVPERAFAAREMTITITALAGDVVAYDFGPDGTQFDRPLLINQSLKGTSWYGLHLGRSLRGAYFRSPSDVHDDSNSASVLELLATELDLLNSQVKFKVSHFSGYMVSVD